jgi:hypothetical protein
MNAIEPGTVLYFGGKTVLTLLKISAVVFAIGFIAHWTSAFIRQTMARMMGPTAFNLIFSPGIAIHEISHAVAAVLFLHEILDVKLFDLKARNGTHGHVVSRPRAVSQFLYVLPAWIKIGDLFIGIAPLIVGPAISFVSLYYLVPGGIFFIQHPTLQNLPTLSWQFGLWIYATIAIISQMELSPADLKGTWKGFACLVLCTFLIALLYFKIKHI